MKQGYGRVLLKLSGEALGQDGWLFDHDMIGRVAGILAQVVQRGVQLGVVIGGGNLWRGRQGGASGMDAVTADHMGMLGTVMNCLCMQDALRRAGCDAQVYSAIDMPRVAGVYHRDTVLQAMEQGTVVLLGGGLGNPFFTTDSAVALRACELKADALLLAKNVDGVYTADPRTDSTATLIADITYDEAISRQLKVMDLSALLLCRDNGLPFIRVFGLQDPANILRVLDGDPMGTLVHP